MSEERLKEIKDCIDLQRAYPILHDDGHLIEQKLELYNEVVRLRKIIKDAKEVLLTTNNVEKALNVLDRTKELEESK